MKSKASRKWGYLIDLNMENHHLSMEQKFNLEAAFRQIDACKDINQLRELTKHVITSQENEKAFARIAIQQMRKEIESSLADGFGFK